MRQHLDTGGVQVEVTHISNGSVLVEFNVLVIADLDIREVAAAFLAAFQDASPLEVVAGDTFLWGTQSWARWSPPPRRGLQGTPSYGVRRAGLDGAPLPAGGEILAAALFLKNVSPLKGFPA